MQARITKPFRCAPEGHTVVTFQPGDTVEGKVARWAVAAGCANEAGKRVAPENKALTPPENKKRGKRK